jgi:hypothetical protein
MVTQAARSNSEQHLDEYSFFMVLSCFDLRYASEYMKCNEETHEQFMFDSFLRIGGGCELIPSKRALSTLTAMKPDGVAL